MCDRGCRNNSAYLHSVKRHKLGEEAIMDENLDAEHKQEMLDAIEDLVVDSMLGEFTCFCGHLIVKRGSKSSFSNELAAHSKTYCSFFILWRKIALNLPETIDGRQAIFNIISCNYFNVNV